MPSRQPIFREQGSDEVWKTWIGVLQEVRQSSYFHAPTAFIHK
jgi:hypothetical protein